jgi:Tol biopolymer transport system component
MASVFAAGSVSPDAGPGPGVRELADEVRGKGWILFGARSEHGDWDLFACRPDGSALRPFTRTPAFSEFAPQFSRDGRKLLYRRMLRAELLDNNRHGEQGELVLADADGSSPVALGKPGEWPWASFGPEATQIASLSIKGISIYDLDRREVVRTLPRRGFFQQLTWSPDGHWLVGVANSFGASWSIARLAFDTGEATAVNRVDCCTPDWFPDNRDVIFSWRPPGQQANQGYGWTQLWRAAADGSSRQLVYAEEGRHVYGGHVSPDGRYVLFTGNVEEDGDPGRAGAPMALMRLSDAPIIGGASRELRALHPKVNVGPVVTLPVGWEPCWTAAELPGTAAAAGLTPTPTPPLTSRRAAGEPAGASGQGLLAPAETNGVATLAREVRACGWIAFSARTAQGDWDLFVMRPDGSDRRALTDTREFNEAGVRFSPDGSQWLYYRMPKTEPVDNNSYGTFELVLARAGGREPVVVGNTFQWASWSPDGKQLACLTPQGIQIIDATTRQVVRQLPRRGIVSQLVWSPEGKHFCGTANGLGPFWNIGCLDSATGAIRAVSETERYNCTSDWAPDGRAILYARGIIPGQAGRAELWEASADGTGRRLLYAEAGRHVYGACASPDGKYLLFTRSIEDLGTVDHTGTTMAIIRRADTPMRGDEDAVLRQRLPDARPGPRLDLGQGWEPHWTGKEMTQ